MSFCWTHVGADNDRHILPGKADAIRGLELLRPAATPDDTGHESGGSANFWPTVVKMIKDQIPSKAGPTWVRSGCFWRSALLAGVMNFCAQIRLLYFYVQSELRLIACASMEDCTFAWGMRS